MICTVVRLAHRRLGHPDGILALSDAKVALPWGILAVSETHPSPARAGQTALRLRHWRIDIGTPFNVISFQSRSRFFYRTPHSPSPSYRAAPASKTGDMD